jgi:hypothetical protein
MNLLVEFCHTKCKFYKEGCEEMLAIDNSIYCPAENFADWLSSRLEQLDLRNK